MTTATTKRTGLFTLVGLAIGMLFLMACSTQPTPTSGAVNVPTGSQVSFDSSSGLARSLGYSDTLSTGIHVTGEGQATGIPDLATLNLGVEAVAGTVQEARDEAAAAMEQVLNVLRAQGIDEDDISTSYFNISPRYSSREFTRCLNDAEVKPSPDDGSPQIMPDERCYQEHEQIITGYQVTNQLMVKVRNLDNVGNVIDAVTGAAGNLIRFQGVYFSMEDTQELQRQAREAAVTNLMNKAGQLAEFSGVELGNLTFLSESGGQVPFNAVSERAAWDMAYAGSVPTPILAGELTVTVSVQGVFAIQ